MLDLFHRLRFNLPTRLNKGPVKLLVFAHVPPPHHGQSYMVKLMLDGLPTHPQSTPAPLQIWHVDARFSTDVNDIGGFRPQKAFLVFSYCLQALKLRFRYGITHFYYVPAPGMRMPVFRDWVVMALCRPCFNKIILHWHSVGLGEWLIDNTPTWVRWITSLALRQAHQSIVLSRYNEADALKFTPRQTRVVSNGIPDPCPDFPSHILPLRLERLATRRRCLHPQASHSSADTTVIRVLFLALCTRDKGLFEAVDGVLLANQYLRTLGARARFVLTIAGKFYTPSDESELQARIANPEARNAIQYKGFVSGAEKSSLLVQSDIFCFPTYYGMEGQPVNLIEAMAHGLSIVATSWRSIPEMLPDQYPGLVEPRSAQRVSQALLQVVELEEAQAMRQRFLAHYSIEHHLASLQSAILDA